MTVWRQAIRNLRVARLSASSLSIACPHSFCRRCVQTKCNRRRMLSSLRAAATGRRLGLGRSVNCQIKLSSIHPQEGLPGCIVCAATVQSHRVFSGDHWESGDYSRSAFGGLRAGVHLWRIA